jgi:hypothetical protein
MAGVYRPRHPERTVLYRVLFHHFDRFLTEYESRFEREYGFFRPVVEADPPAGFFPDPPVEKYLPDRFPVHRAAFDFARGPEYTR